LGEPEFEGERHGLAVGFPANVKIFPTLAGR
jgi:hypothetical protein